MKINYLSSFMASCILVSSYAAGFSNPEISQFSNTLQEEYIDDDYVPEWLTESMNLSGVLLSVAGKGSWGMGAGSPRTYARLMENFGMGWILKSQYLDSLDFRNFAIVLTLPGSGLTKNDPEPFEPQKLAMLNQQVDGIKRGAYESDYDPKSVNDGQTKSGFDNGGVKELHRLYISGETKPSQVVKGVLAWMDQEQGGIPDHLKDTLIKRIGGDVIALQQAHESDDRWSECKARLSPVLDHDDSDISPDEIIEECMRLKIIRPLEGVPIVVKDEINVEGYTTSSGLDPAKMNISTELVIHDKNSQSEVVTRMVEAGVVVLGKSNQHVFGLGATGLNPFYPRLSNVFSKDHVPGGSSSGSAVFVAMKAGPLALGTDGGGSVSIPAMNNGLPGLKPSEDKIPVTNYDNPAKGLVSIGLIGTSFKDIEVGYRITARKKPTVSVRETMKNIRIGIDKAFFKATEEVAEISLGCLDSLAQALEDELGAQNPIMPMKVLPDDYRKRLWATHLILFGRGEAVGNGKYIDYYHLPAETRLALLMGEALSEHHVGTAKDNQKIMIDHMENNIFSRFDVIAMPTAMVTAPEIEPSWDVDGELNLTKAYKMSGYTSPANLTGEPRVTVHCGFDKNNLPVGLQLWGGRDSEYLLLALGDLLESRMTEQLRDHPAWGKRALFDVRDSSLPETHGGTHRIKPPYQF